MKNLTELIYSLIIGLAIAVFGGFAVWAAYPGPKMPMPEFNISYDSPEGQKQQSEVDKQYQEFDKKNANHNEKSLAILLGVSAVLYLLGVLANKSRKFSEVFVEGLLFGGAIIAFYAALKSSPFAFFYPGPFSEGPNRLLVLSSAGLLLIMILGIIHIRFGILTAKPNSKKK